ncbi:NUDIX hydrolase [Paracoccus fistulariae]|uniref:NUDIX hydrolase n=1 Tax=Paracoccus fistulariae TaxID=658446 RepID=A0ABY7SI34_9RHOB|nr:NUDIX hydrolase [Paracoccus fistulariae]MDB6182089.1 NUDIX hydrolase [Paracoccus fistulariae]WCR06680.1 NUDIX hydrolase [Paracoccus fistulariae]
MIPRFGKTPLRGQSYRRRPGAYAILYRDGHLLMTHQVRPSPEYQLPGGGIDPGEGPITALHREVFEETGFSIAAPRYLGSYRRYAYLPDYGYHAEKMCHVWLARPILRRGPPTEPHHDACWMTPERAYRLLPDAGSRAMLRRSGLIRGTA